MTDTGHDHVLTVGVTIGPLVLRVALLGAVLAVTGFAMLRGFIGPPERSTTAWVVSAAGVAAVMDLLLSGGLSLPAQTVPLVLAALAGPLYVALSRDPRFALFVARLRSFAPWVCALAGAGAVVELGRAWLADGRPGTALHSGVVLSLVALSWFVVSRPARLPVATLGLRIGAAALAMMLLAGTSQAMTQAL